MKYYALLFLVSLIVPACSSTNKLSETKNMTSLLDYNITISKGGGFTGNYEGYKIDSTGTVSSFEGIITSNLKKVYRGAFTKDQIDHINKLFPAILKISCNESGNMTTSITLGKVAHELNYAWAGVVPGKNVPSELVRFYEELNNIINHLKE